MRYVPSPFGDNILWLQLKPKELTYGKKKIFYLGDQVTATSKGGPLHLVAPESFMDQVNHTWEPLENVASRLQGIQAQTQTELSQGRVQHKVDTASLYSDSDRRQISMTVHLGAYHDPQTEIMDIVDYLRKESCPELAEGLRTKVGHPTVFEVKTTPVELFAINNAALTSVQPTFYSPFFVGNDGNKGPSRCELTLEFKDIEPLTKSRVVPEGGSIVTTSATGLQQNEGRGIR